MKKLFGLYLTLFVFMMPCTSFGLTLSDSFQVTDEENQLLEKYRSPCIYVWGQYALSFINQKSADEVNLHHLAGHALYIARLHIDKFFHQLVQGRMHVVQERNPYEFRDVLEDRDLKHDFVEILGTIKAYDSLHADGKIEHAMKTFACYGAHRKRWGYEESVSLVGISDGTGNY